MEIVRVVPSSPCGGSLVANPKFSPSAAAALTASTAIPKFVNDRIKCSRFTEPSVLVVAASTSMLKVCTTHRNVLSSSWCYPPTTTWATLAQNSQTHTETVAEPVKPEKPQMGMLSDPQLAVLSDIEQTRIRNGTKEARECRSSSSRINDSSTSIITHSGLQESSTHSGPPVLGSNHNWERTIAALQDCIGSGQNLRLQEMKEKKKKPVDDMLHNLAKAVATIIFEENLPTEKIMAVVNEIGLRVEVRSMNMVIWELGQLQDSQGAGNAFQAFRAAGVEPNTHVCTTLIAIYGYVRQLPLALELFKWMEQREMARPLYTFNALIVACGRSGASNDAVELFEEMQKLGVRPDRITYVGVISATTASGQWDLAQSFIRKMQAEGYKIEEREYTEMLWACARARKPREALGLFQEMLERGYRPTLVNYNSLLSAYEKAGQWEEALRTFVWIQDDGFLPDIMSWSTLISACANGGQAEIASEVLERMKASGCRPNIVSWCGLIKAHQKIGNWKGAERTFEAMLDDGCVPNEVAWCSLLSAYEKGQQWKKVLHTVSKLQLLGHKLDVVAWSTTISALAKAGRWELAEQIFESMQQEGCTPNIVTYTSLMKAYGNAGLWEKAEATFKLMLKRGLRPNAQSCCALLRAYAKGRELKRAVFLFERMADDYGVFQDKYAYTAIFWACWSCGEWQQAAQYFDQMERAGCIPDSIIYTTLMRMYEAHGQVDKAMEVLERMRA